MNGLRQFIHFLHGTLCGLGIWAFFRIANIPNLEETMWPLLEFFLVTFVVFSFVLNFVEFFSYVELHWKDVD